MKPEDMTDSEYFGEAGWGDGYLEEPEPEPDDECYPEREQEEDHVGD